MLCAPKSPLFPYTTLFRSHQRAYCFATFRLCTQVDGQCCAGQAEHHDWKETRLVLANHADDFTGDAVPYATAAERVDRKSTRLNSSHVAISYAVFCLKNKK